MANPAAKTDGQRAEFRNESRTTETYNNVGDRRHHATSATFAVAR